MKLRSQDVCLEGYCHLELKELKSIANVVLAKRSYKAFVFSLFTLVRLILAQCRDVPQVRPPHIHHFIHHKLL